MRQSCGARDTAFTCAARTTHPTMTQAVAARTRVKATASGRFCQVALAAAVIGCGAAAAQDAAKPFPSPSYPAGVQQVLQAARDACKAQGGGEVTFAPDTVRALDLTGGKHNDYIVDLRNAVCQDRD